MSPLLLKWATAGVPLRGKVFERRTALFPIERNHSMDMKEVMVHVRRDLRDRPDSHFSEVCFRVLKRGASTSEVHTVFYEIPKRDEVTIIGGKWRLAAPVERRPVS